MLIPTRKGIIDEPENEVDDVGHKKGNEPEPEQQVHLLQEQVDGEDTLHRESLHIGQLPDLIVTQAYPGEGVVVLPAPCLCQCAHSI